MDYKENQFEEIVPKEEWDQHWEEWYQGPCFTDVPPKGPFRKNKFPPSSKGIF